jgi:hypothetical protein
MFRRRIQRTLFEVPAWIATAEDILLHKLYWDKLTPSDRQRGDAVGVFKVQGAALDLDYLRAWAAELGVETNLKLLLEGKMKPKQT